jgi:hypothetical protein
MFHVAYRNGGFTIPSKTIRLKTKIKNHLYLQVAPGLVFETENTYANQLTIENFVLALVQNKNKTYFSIPIYMEQCPTPYIMLDAYDVKI